ncbi:hypothetical protein [Actinoalloteichus caeruleus]|uniref:DUF5709 domain-containing protein n=1 Tax=Actinoalloteichus caeruleus DSM 43889 TaxID=1120930 RepID=A0ABT1JEZ8_ACTCY|nr:hypothetical protein [Actinoalloteichus caeruleus]MCP2331073.1 hypothetical protein [Actinoalloteichus caeruleus DSM 43889]
MSLAPPPQDVLVDPGGSTPGTLDAADPGGEPTALARPLTDAPEGAASGISDHDPDGDPVGGLTPPEFNTPTGFPGARAVAVLTGETPNRADDAVRGTHPRGWVRHPAPVHHRPDAHRPSRPRVTGGAGTPASSKERGGDPVDDRVPDEEITHTDAHDLQAGNGPDRQLSRGDLAPACAPVGIGGRAQEAGQ